VRRLHRSRQRSSSDIIRLFVLADQALVPGRLDLGPCVEAVAGQATGRENEALTRLDRFLEGDAPATRGARPGYPGRPGRGIRKAIRIGGVASSMGLLRLSQSKRDRTRRVTRGSLFEEPMASIMTRTAWKNTRNPLPSQAMTSLQCWTLVLDYLKIALGYSVIPVLVALLCWIFREQIGRAIDATGELGWGKAKVKLRAHAARSTTRPPQKLRLRRPMSRSTGSPHPGLVTLPPRSHRNRGGNWSMPSPRSFYSPHVPPADCQAEFFSPSFAGGSAGVHRI
jgi:hypothetical protein